MVSASCGHYGPRTDRIGLDCICHTPILKPFPCRGICAADANPSQTSLTDRLSLLEMLIFSKFASPELHMNSPTLTGHPVTSLWQMTNISKWMSWDVMKAGKGLSKIFETLHSASPSRLSPVQTSFCGLDLFSRSWGRLKETWSLEDCIHQNFSFKTTRNK